MSEIQSKNVANLPGHIAFDRGGGDSYSGCALKFFLSSTEVNEFFTNNPGYLVVQIAPADGGIYVTYTAVLSQDDMDDLREWSMNQQTFMAERKAAREQARLSSEDVAVREAAENARLRELGRKCEQNHKKTKMGK